jgi:hypothetical protein
MAQVVSYLPNKCKALSQTLVLPKYKLKDGFFSLLIFLLPGFSLSLLSNQVHV